MINNINNIIVLKKRISIIIFLIKILSSISSRLLILYRLLKKNIDYFQ